MSRFLFTMLVALTGCSDEFFAGNEHARKERIQEVQAESLAAMVEALSKTNPLLPPKERCAVVVDLVTVGWNHGYIEYDTRRAAIRGYCEAFLSAALAEKE